MENESIRKKYKKRIKIKIKEYLIITIGCILMAAGISFFLLPNELSIGGFAGIGTILYYLFKIPLGVTIILLNLPVLILAYIKLGRKLFIRSIYGTIMFSVLLDLFNLLNIQKVDKFLSCIYGGILTGIGTAIVLRMNSSTGGSDLLSYIIKEYKAKYRTSKIIFTIDAIIITLNVLFFKKLEVGLYSTIVIFIMGKMIDFIFEGINFTKIVLIISPKYEEIALKIGNKLNRGSTGIYAKGMYTNNEKMMLLCVGSRTEAYDIEKIAKKEDNSSFIIILNAREVLGKGFK